MPLVPPKQGSERALYYSIWAVLLICLALWWFRPVPEIAPKEVPILLAPEVRPWFLQGSVQRTKGHSLTIGLVLTPEFQRSLRLGKAGVNVRYRVSHSTGPGSEGSASIRLTAESSVGTVLVNLRSSEPPTQIEFFLR